MDEAPDDYLDDALSDEVARILYRDYQVDPANIPDQIFDLYPDFAADAIAERGLTGTAQSLSPDLTKMIAAEIASMVADQVREAEEDTTTRYTVWDVPESAVMPAMLATNLTCVEAMAFRAEREDDDSDAPSGLLIYPIGQAWWEWED